MSHPLLSVDRDSGLPVRPMLRLGKLVAAGRVGDAGIYDHEVVADELDLIRRMASEKWLVRKPRC